MAQPAETFLPSGTLIATTITGVATGPDSVPQLTLANGSPIDAVLELQSTSKALCITRLTTAQKNNLNATPGMICYDATLGEFHIYTGGNVWEPIIPGESGGLIPNFITAGPVQMQGNNLYVMSSGGNINLTLPLAASLGDEIVLLAKTGTFTILQNASQSIIFLQNTSTVGVGGSVAAISAGCGVTLNYVNANTFQVKASVGSFLIV